MILLIVLVVFFLFIGVFEIVQSTQKPSRLPSKAYPVLRLLVGLLSLLIVIFFVAAIISLNFSNRFPGIFF